MYLYVITIYVQDKVAKLSHTVLQCCLPVAVSNKYKILVLQVYCIYSNYGQASIPLQETILPFSVDTLMKFSSGTQYGI